MSEDTATNTEPTGLEIAVIGMSGRFPGARNIDEFWNNLENGVESISFFSDQELEAEGVDPRIYKQPNYVKAKGIVPDADCFDAFFFDYSPMEVEIMDPQMRMFHHCIWEALEDGGYVPDTFNGLIGLYAGATNTFFWEALTLVSGAGSDIDGFSASQLRNRDYLASRISYKLNLQGPCYVVQTACSTSLVAIHLASRALLTGECHMALAGGVTISSLRKEGYFFEEVSINSPDGHCRAFDARAEGTVGGDGAGVVLLKPLEDALADGDHIYAVIKSSAINNDGSRKVGYTAPSIEGQVDSIRMAHQFGQIEPESIGYIETHGTATKLGDPVEVEALKLAFASVEHGNSCAIGSVKSNVGHLDSAAGVTGFIKTALSLAHRKLPPSLHYESPNPKIDFENSPFYVNASLQPWRSSKYPLRAGVSAFGIGGTNAHVVLEEAPRQANSSAGRAYQLLLLSAKTSTALKQRTRDLADYFREKPGGNLADAAYTLHVGRKAFNHRQMIVCSSTADALTALQREQEAGRSHTAGNKNRPVIFMFSGQGSQYVQMGAELYQKEPFFREQMDHCFSRLQTIMGEDIKDIIYPEQVPAVDAEAKKDGAKSHRDIFKEKINQFKYTSPLKFTFEYSLARLLMKWGITPYAMIGHSFGEYVAACIAGVFSVDDGLTLAALRGRLMHQLPGGSMLSVSLPEEELRILVESCPDIDLAAVNGPRHCIVSGPIPAVAGFQDLLTQKDIESVLLRVPRAGHSKMMLPILGEFEDRVRRISLSKPKIPYISGLTGNWITVDDAVDPKYWARHLRETIRFYQGLEVLLEEEDAIFVQVGSDRSLSTFADLHPAKKDSQQVLNLIRHPKDEISDIKFLLHKLGLLWLYGKSIDTAAFYSGETRQRLPMPTYPFQPRKFRLKGDPFAIAMENLSGGGLVKKDDIGEWFYSPSWIRSGRTGGPTAPTAITGLSQEKSNWLCFCDNSGLGTRLARHLEQLGQTVTTVTAGTGFDKTGDTGFTLAPREPDHYTRLLKELDNSGRLPSRVIHLWSVTGATPGTAETLLEKGFYSLFNLAVSLGSLGMSHPLHIDVISDAVQDVTGTEVLNPLKATVLGPVKVIPLEFSNIICRGIDVLLPAPGSPREEDAFQLLTRQILAEIALPGARPLTAFRGSNRWEQTFKPLRLQEPGKKMPRLKQKGCYLLTGGLGGIGLVLARYLAETLQARLILTGRSPFPPKEARRQWLDSHPENDPISEKIRLLTQLEDLGAEVLTLEADVSEKTSMQQVFSQAGETFGRIDGVIHAAGVPDGAAIEIRSRKQTSAVLSPKVTGTLVLEEILNEHPTDFLLLCSSVNAIQPVFGQLSHCAANAFLDAFALSRAGDGAGMFTLSVNWPAWLEVGQAAVAPGTETGTASPFGLRSAEGVEVFRRVLGSNDEVHVVVSTMDFTAALEQLRAVEDVPDEDEPLEEEIPELSAQRPELNSRYTEPQTPTQEALAKVWQNFFGYNLLGINDDFFELGGDSLKATILAGKIHKQLNVKVPLKEIFSRPNIQDLGRYIDREHGTGAAENARFMAVEPAETRDYYPLSSAQSRLFILQQMEPESTAYNIPLLMPLDKTVDREKIESVFQLLIQRHESFRTAFFMHRGQAVQKVYPSVDFEIPYLQTSEAEAGALLEDLNKPFDLSRPPLLRAALLELTGERLLLVLDIHHTIVDGFSLNLIQEEFNALYSGSSLPLPRLQYRDYVIWRHNGDHRTSIGLQETYWLKQFPGEIPVLEFPLDFPRPAIQTFEGSFLNFRLDNRTVEKLKALAASEDATLFMILLAVFDVLLARLSRQEDIVAGTPVSGRGHSDFTAIIGLFVNTLPLRSFPASEKEFTAFLKEVREHTLAAFENQEYPFEDLVEKVAVKRDMSRNPLFDVAFSMQNQQDAGGGHVNTPQETSPQENPDSWESSGLYTHLYRVSKFDMTLNAVEFDGQLHLSIDYCTRLFKKETISRFAQYFEQSIDAVLEKPRSAIGEIEFLTQREKQRLLIDFNRTGAAYPYQKTIHALFEEQVERVPDNIALTGDGCCAPVNYRELNRKANQLARVLQKNGLQAESLVALLLEPSLEMITAILAVLKAGGAYLPIAPDAPPERIDYMLRESNAACLISSATLQKDRVPSPPLPVLDPCNPMHYTGETANLEIPIPPTALAYVIYTSGTTGKPKGVLIRHEQVVRLMFTDNYLFDFNDSDVWTMFHSYSFDFSVWEMYGALLYGGRLVLIPRAVARDTGKYLDILKKEKVTLLNQTPSAFYSLAGIETQQSSHRLALRYIIFGGEALKPVHLREWRKKYPHTRLINMFGITETTVHVTFKEIGDAEIESNLSNIGRPIPTLTAYVMDSNLKLLPVGVPGELCVGGKGVARGYLNNPRLTHEKFTANPYKSGEILYRSGDRVRLFPDGDMEYLGRIDRQVKIRGFRIELAEIENALLQHASIKNTVVTLIEGTQQGDSFLCAYIVTAEGEPAVEAPVLKPFLSTHLPEYMIPTFFVPMDALPLTSNGKVDYRALPAPETGVSGHHVPPATNNQKRMTELWAEVLELEEDKIGIDDDFFELGGHSLKAVRLASQIHRDFNINLPLTEIFQSPTVRLLTGSLDRQAKNRFTAIHPVEEKEYYPMSSAQKRLFVLQQVEKNSIFYNMPQVVPLSASPDIPHLESVIKALINRHEILRTSFFIIEDQPVQRVLPISRVSFKVERFESGDAGSAGEAEASKAFIRPFDLSRAPLLRLALQRNEAGESRLLFDMHHIITDGTSQQILSKDLRALLRGEELPPLKLQYKDYSQWQNSHRRRETIKKQEAFWLEEFSGEIPVLDLPTDFPRPMIQRFEGNLLEFYLDKQELESIRKIAQRQNLTIYMVLSAIFNILFHKLSGREDIVIGTPVAARPHVDLQQVAGMFVNTLPMRNFPAPGKTAADFLEELKQRTLEAFEHQEFPFEDLVDKISVSRDAGRNPVFDIMLNLLNQADFQGAVPKPGGKQPFKHSPGTSRFDMTINAVDLGELLLFNFEYSTALYKPATMERFVYYLKRIILQVAADGNLKIADIRLLDEEEENRVLQLSQGAVAPLEPGLTIHRLFERQAAATPHSTALIMGRQRLDYLHLNQAANRLARLLRERGVTVDTVVAIMTERSFDMVIALLAILKAGGAYLPIDPRYPENRIREILSDREITHLISKQEPLERFYNHVSDPSSPTGEPRKIPDITVIPGDEKNGFKETKRHIIVLEDIEESLQHYDPENLEHINRPEDLLYVIHTSGSTGKPKGVMLEHRNLVNLLQFQETYTDIDFSSVLQFATLCFDASFQEIFSTLLRGGKLCLIDRDMVQDVPRLFKVVEENQVNTLVFPASYLKFLFSETHYVELLPNCIRHIITAGEQVVINDLFRKYLKDNHVYLHNHYGPSETHVITALTLDPRGEIPELPNIGRPVSNSSVYIVDKHMRLVPEGVPGELYLGGIQVGRGYLGREQLTAERFIPDPFTGEGYMYRTGDLGAWLPDGNIQFLGRIDFQVKIRGFRVELGEIESRLLNYPNIKDAVVLARVDKNDNQNYLCAYYVSPKNIDDVELREYLAKELPDYMVPAYFVTLPRMPLTTNRKVDRKALPLPETNAGETLTLPKGPVEKKVVEIWARVLGCEPGHVGRDSNFFQQGGHSLKATVLLSRLHKEFSVKVPLGEMFRKPTPAGLADAVKAARPDSYNRIGKTETKESYTLSSAQKRLFILQQMNPAGVAYNMPLAVPLESAAKRETLEKTFRELILRHESLRTSFHIFADEPVQVIHEEVDFHVEVYKKNAGGDLNTYIRPFELSNAPLLRAGIIEAPGKGRLLMVDMHHIISDGVSHRVLLKDFTALYRGETLEPLHIQYKDFAEWQNANSGNETISAQQSYWLKVFNREIPVLAIAADYPRPAVQSFEGHAVSFRVEGEHTAQLRKAAREEGATLYMVLLTIYNILAAKLSGQDDVVTGTPIAGRRHADLESIIGIFINTLALRNHPQPGKSLKDFLAEIKHNTLEAFENQEYQFEDLVDLLAADVTRDISRNPLFDIMFSLQNQAELEKSAVDFPNESESEDSPGDFENRVSKFDMTLTGREVGDTLFFDLTYCTRLFKEETIRRFAAYFKNILCYFLQNKNTDKTIGDTRFIPEEEKQQLLYTFNIPGEPGSTFYENNGSKTLHALFLEQAEKTPERIAVEYRQEELTYRQLQRRAGQVARVIRSRGIRNGDITGLMTQRSLEMIVGIMAILEAGAAYLPISPEAPAERIKYMLRDCRSTVVLTRDIPGKENHSVIEALEEIIPAGNILSIGGAGDGENGMPRPGNTRSPQDPAYVIYTSGTTGKPKGVAVTHQNTMHLVSGLKERIYFRDRAQKNALLSPYVFDASIKQIFPTLLLGHTLVIVPENARFDGEELLQYYRDKHITLSDGTPAHLEIILNCPAESLKDFPIETFVIGGEELEPGLCRRMFEHVDKETFEIFNAYGPTECTDVTSLFRVTRENAGQLIRIPIGRPLPNVRAYILGPQRELQPIGVPGELHIAGKGVTGGYLNRAPLTAGSFISIGEFPEITPDDKTRGFLYRSGDLCRWLPDGYIEFMGRSDRQVKIRGFRIEPGEIENRLREEETISNAVVMPHREKDNLFLCAYIVAREEINFSHIQEKLANHLPDYMIPRYIMQLASIPLTANGKIDYNALPVPHTQKNDAEHVAPRDYIEEKLAAIWAEVLTVEQRVISIDSNFFRLGGHSLRAVIAAAGIHKAFNVKIPLREIFKTPTIRGLGSYLKKAGKDRHFDVTRTESRDYYPLAPAQRRLFTLQRMEPENTAYNMPRIIPLGENIDPEQLEKAFRLLIQRHESLRTSFHIIAGQAVQKIHDTVPFVLQHPESGAGSSGQATGNPMVHLVRPFDLTEPPLLRVLLLNGPGGNKQGLFIDMHHIITDGVSNQVLTRDFMLLYEGKELPGLKLQYKDFAQWQNRLLESGALAAQESYWLDRFKDETPFLGLLHDEDGGGAGKESSFYFELEPHLTAEIKTLIARSESTLYIVLLAVYTVLLGKYANREDLVVSSPVAGRTHDDLKHIIGMFVNMVPMRNLPQQGKTFTRFLEEVKKNALDAFDNQDYPFDLLVEKLDMAGEGSRNPLTEAVFVLEEAQTGEGVQAPASGEEEEAAGKENTKDMSAKFDITLNARETGGAITFTFEYRGDLFSSQTIEKKSRHLVNIIRHITENPEVFISEIKMLDDEDQLDSFTSIDEPDLQADFDF